jgi:hypothetical protein
VVSKFRKSHPAESAYLEYLVVGSGVASIGYSAQMMIFNITVVLGFVTFEPELGGGGGVRTNGFLFKSLESIIFFMLHNRIIFI